jgi:hypothetical protein
MRTQAASRGQCGTESSLCGPEALPLCFPFPTSIPQSWKISFPHLVTFCDGNPSNFVICSALLVRGSTFDHTHAWCQAPQWAAIAPGMHKVDGERRLLSWASTTWRLLRNEQQRWLSFREVSTTIVKVLVRLDSTTANVAQRG